jgi:NAD(P)-dependent dehydrogenase (short-subunit alcohol dehydrogenase family)
MVERRFGSVVVIGSINGKRPFHGRTPYAASKTGLAGLMRTLAHELGPHGLRANLIPPGPVGGERVQAVIREQARIAGTSFEMKEAELTSGSALKRLIAPDDVASGAVFLASDEAASITGEDLNVSAGLVMC